MHVIAVVNQKGGSGKTTSCINLAAALAKLNKKVLVIDLDPQGHATVGLGFDVGKKLTIANMLGTDSVDIHQVIYPTGVNNLDIIPSNLKLGVAEMNLSMTGAKEFRLRRKISSINGNSKNESKYDYVFIDCPPTFGTLTTNAFMASSNIIVPFELSFFNLEGVDSLLETISIVNKEIGYVNNHQINILGVLITFYDLKTKISREVDQEIRRLFGNKVFQTTIPINVALHEAQASGKTIFDYKPDCRGSIAYQSLAEELLERTK